MIPSGGAIAAVIVAAMERSPIRPGDGDATLDVWVVPGAGRTELAGLFGESLKIRVAAPAADGQANRALLRFLRELLGCGVALERGAGSRQKRIRIESGDLAGIAQALGIRLG